MENYKFQLVTNGVVNVFEVAEYPHHEDEQCRFEIFKDGTFAAGFEPDRNEVVRLCKDPGMLPQTLLHEIAEYLQEYQVSGKANPLP